MQEPITAVEMTGIIDKDSQLHLDGILPIKGPQRVRGIALSALDDGAEWDESEWLQAAARNPAFDFWQEVNNG